MRSGEHRPCNIETALWNPHQRKPHATGLKWKRLFLCLPQCVVGSAFNVKHTSLAPHLHIRKSAKCRVVFFPTFPISTWALHETVHEEEMWLKGKCDQRTLNRGGLHPASSIILTLVLPAYSSGLSWKNQSSKQKGSMNSKSILTFLTPLFFFSNNLAP